MPASIPLVTTHINRELVAYYAKQTQLLNAIDEWVLVPDYKLLPELVRLRHLVNKHQPHRDAKTVLYRGFTVGANYQNDLKVDLKGKYNDLKRPIGVTFDHPTSFTTEKSIAETFGDTVISIRPGAHLNKFLRLTDELCLAICEHRKIDPETQCEWIFLPYEPTEFMTTFIRHEKPKWYEFWK
ncbi:hypothetical protein pEaSNUABM54_00027 [Erwinia phage pEa_SNUABM_54]|nr:hypothetical protein pEaSNUABM54_00027 [Erwinia phage pEa_SNUABM_54]